MLQLGHVARGAAVAHSAAVVLDGRAVLVAGWSESGKTETALALMEDGARFLSDKWTVLAPTARRGSSRSAWGSGVDAGAPAAAGRGAREAARTAPVRGVGGAQALTPLQRGRAADPLDRLVRWPTASR